LAASTEPNEDLTQIPRSSESVARVYIQTIFGRFNSRRGFVGSREQPHVNLCIDRVIRPRGPYSIRSRELWYRSNFSVIAFRRFVGVFLTIFFSYKQWIINVKSQNREKRFCFIQAMSRTYCHGNNFFSPAPRVASYSAQTERAEGTRGLRKEDSILAMDHHEPCRGTSISGYMQ